MVVVVVKFNLISFYFAPRKIQGMQTLRNRN